MDLFLTASSETPGKTSATVVDIAEIEPRKLALVKAFSNDGFLKYALPDSGKLHFKSRERIALLYHGPKSISLFVEALNQAFHHHIPFTLSPETLWYLICHEIGIHVRQNAKKHARLFTKTPDEKQVIRVRDDSLVYGDPDNDWAGSIHLLVDPMKKFMGEARVDFFLPKFTTGTDESEAAILISFMDMVSSYYELECYTLCGIPRIHIQGQEEDWRLLLRRTEKLAAYFHDLTAYFRDLLPVLDKILNAVNGERDTAFWKSVYKIDNNSGGPYISGWVTALFAYVSTDKGPRLKENFDWQRLYDAKGFGGYTANKFPVNVSKVDFKWISLGKNIPMIFASGVLGVDYENQSLTPKLGYAVFEQDIPRDSGD